MSLPFKIDQDDPFRITPGVADRFHQWAEQRGIHAHAGPARLAVHGSNMNVVFLRDILFDDPSDEVRYAEAVLWWIRDMQDDASRWPTAVHDPFSVPEEFREEAAVLIARTNAFKLERTIAFKNVTEKIRKHLLTRSVSSPK